MTKEICKKWAKVIFEPFLDPENSSFCVSDIVCVREFIPKEKHRRHVWLPVSHAVQVSKAVEYRADAMTSLSTLKN